MHDAETGDTPADDPGPLVVATCRALCAWGPTGRTRGGLPLFACSGCGSEWLRSEAWTPADHTGRVPGPVAAEAARRYHRARRGRG